MKYSVLLSYLKASNKQTENICPNRNVFIQLEHVDLERHNSIYEEIMFVGLL